MMDNEENIENENNLEITVQELIDLCASLKEEINLLKQHDHDGKKSKSIDYAGLKNKPTGKNFDHKDLNGVSNNGDNGHVKGGDSHDHSEKSGGSQIDHHSLKNKGKYSHEKLDKHIDDQDNPHKVTIEQIGALPKDGGKIKVKKKIPLSLERDDIGIILELISQGKLVLSVSDKGLVLKTSLKADGIESDKATIKYLNGIDLENIFSKKGQIDHDKLSNTGNHPHKDIDKHIDTKGNPHGTSAKDIGALSLDGGKIDGGLEICLGKDKAFIVSLKDKTVLLINDKGEILIDSLSAKKIKVSTIDGLEKIGNMSVDKDGRISHKDIAGKGKYDHEKIDQHIDEKGNPHGLTLEDLAKSGGKINGRNIAKSSIDSEHLNRHVVSPDHLSPETIEHFKSLIPGIDLDSIAILVNEAISGIHKEMEQMQKYVEKMVEEIPQSNDVSVLNTAPEQPSISEDRLIPSDLKMSVEKYMLMLKGVRGLSFKSGDNIVSINGDGLFINGQPWINKEEKVIVQEQKIDVESVVGKMVSAALQNLVQENTQLKKELTGKISQVENSLNTRIEEILANLSNLSEKQGNDKNTSNAINDIINNIEGIRFEKGKMIIEHESIQFLAKEIHFNSTASIDQDGNFDTEGNVCKIDLNEIGSGNTIDHDKLKNSGNKKHSDLDKHLNLKTNPHGVNLSQMKDAELLLNEMAELKEKMAILEEKMKNL